MAKYRLEELCEIITDGTHQTPDYCDELEGVKFLSSKDVTDRVINWDNVKYIPYSLHEDLYKRLRPKKNDILLAKNGTTGIAALVDRDEIFDIYVSLALLRPQKSILPKYLLYAVNSSSARRQFNAGLKGIGVPNLHLSVIRKTEVSIAPREEQESICNILDCVSSVIELRKKELVQLDELIKARFVEMFGDPVQNPKGYRVESLQKLIEDGDITYHLDGNHGGDYPRSEEFVDSGVPYIGANCIANGEIDFSLAKFLTKERAGKLRKGIAQDEDVLFAHNATVGPTVVLHTDEPKVILSTSLTAYRCNKKSILPEYLATYMKSDGFVSQYSSEMKQTTRNQIPITAQKRYLFLIPPIDEQRSFSDFVRQVDKSKSVIQSSLDEAKLLFDCLMQQYFG